jgi:ankyrin repeat protein
MKQLTTPITTPITTPKSLAAALGMILNPEFNKSEEARGKTRANLDKALENYHGLFVNFIITTDKKGNITSVKEPEGKPLEENQTVLNLKPLLINKIEGGDVIVKQLEEKLNAQAQEIIGAICQKKWERVKELIAVRCRFNSEDLDANVDFLRGNRDFLLSLAGLETNKTKNKSTSLSIDQQRQMMRSIFSNIDSPECPDYIDFAISLVQIGFDYGFDVDDDGETPIHSAIMVGGIDLLYVFIDVGADLEVRSKLFDNPLSFAVDCKLIKFAKALIYAGANPNCRDVLGSTPLHSAIINKDLETIMFLMNNGADINAKNDKSETPLQVAIDMGLSEVIQELISRKAVVDAEAFCSAVSSGNVKTVELLIGAGANVNDANQKGSVPIYLVCRKNDGEIARLLLRQRPDLSGERDECKETPLHYAIRSGATKVVDALINHILESGLEKIISKRDIDGYTPLVTAISECQFSIAKLLLLKGADVKELEVLGLTPPDFSYPLLKNLLGDKGYGAAREILRVHWRKSHPEELSNNSESSTNTGKKSSRNRQKPPAAVAVAKDDVTPLVDSIAEVDIAENISTPKQRDEAPKLKIKEEKSKVVQTGSGSKDILEDNLLPQPKISQARITGKGNAVFNNFIARLDKYRTKPDKPIDEILQLGAEFEGLVGNLTNNFLEKPNAINNVLTINLHLVEECNSALKSLKALPDSSGNANKLKEIISNSKSAESILKLLLRKQGFRSERQGGDRQENLAVDDGASSSKPQLVDFRFKDGVINDTNRDKMVGKIGMVIKDKLKKMELFLPVLQMTAHKDGQLFMEGKTAGKEVVSDYVVDALDLKKRLGVEVDQFFVNIIANKMQEMLDEQKVQPRSKGKVGSHNLEKKLPKVFPNKESGLSDQEKPTYIANIKILFEAAAAKLAEPDTQIDLKDAPKAKPVDAPPALQQ